MPSLIYTAHNVSLFYRSEDGKGFEALRNVNYTVEKGEFFTIIGPSGCGKTTLLKLMNGLMRPSSGEIVFADKELRGPPKGIGMAFQDSLLLPWRNVINNVLLPIEILRLPKDRYVRKAEDLLATVGLEGFAHKASWQLSGGMRQRASLCRALINDPQVLLLDEPFGALDAFTREELWLVLQTLHRKEGGTIILVTHQLNEAVFLSDRIIVLSARPGEVIHEEKIALAKPRNLDIAYTEGFLGYVNSLRKRIEK